MDAPAPFFDGEIDDPIKFEDGWNRDPRYCIESSQPVPFVLTALAYDVDLKNS
jgi:hypothetical protein